MLDLFPFQTIRESQKKVLGEIKEAYKSGYRIVVLEASTGFGKSPVAITVAKYFHSSYICTSTINLQDQYLRDFPFVKKIVGKNNFPCQVLHERSQAGKFKCERCETTNIKECNHTTVDRAPCKNRKKFSCSYATTRMDYEEADYDGQIRLIPALRMIQENPQRANEVQFGSTEFTRVNNFLMWEHYKDYGNSWSPCEYFHQKNIGLLNPHTIFNYAIFNKMAQIKRKTGKPYLNTKGVLILDEGHLFESEVIAHNGEELELNTIRNLTHDRVAQLPESLTFSEWVEFLIKVVEYTEKNILELQAEQEKLEDKGRNITQKELKRYHNLADIIDYVEEKKEKLYQLTLDMREHSENWIIDRNNNNKLIIKPLDITEYCRELYQYGDRLLVMSATILDKELYCKQIGLDPDEIKFISVDSDFPVENRPIFTPYMGKLSKDNIDLPSTHEVIKNNIEKLMDQYHNVRGIIHAPTNKLIDQIVPLMTPKNRKRLFIIKSMKAFERTEVLKQFESTPNGVLISPSLYVGIDLKDDLSRFQIIIKVPYASLGDRWIKKKFDQNKQWYQWQTALKLIQGYGRSVRHNKDFCDTFVLDSNFENILRYSSSMLPKSFVEAVRYGKSNPSARVGIQMKNVSRRDR